MDATEQQVSRGLVRREIDRPRQLGDGFAVAALLEQPPPAIEMEGRELLLLALARNRYRVVDSVERGDLQRQLEPLEPARDSLATRSSRSLRPLGVRRGQLRSELALARCLGGRAGCLQ